MIKATKSGKYQVDLYDESGSRVRATFASKKSAQVYETNFLAVRKSVGNKRTQKGDPLTISEAIVKYAVNVSAKKRPRTNKDEKLFFKRMFAYLHDEIGLRTTEEVTKEHLIGLQDYLLDQELTPSSVNRYFHTYKNFFECLVEWEFLERNPCRKVKPLEETPKIREIWNQEEIDAVMAELSPWARQPFRFLAATARRPGQAADLRFCDFTFERGTYRTTSRKGNGKATEQFFPITGEVRKIFEEQEKDRKDNPVIGPNAGFLFLSANNLRLNSHSLGREVKRACVQTCVQNRVAYGLRHTVLTNASEINLEHARLIGGHSSLKTTQRYLHADRKDVLRTMEEAQLRLKEGGAKV